MTTTPTRFYGPLLLSAADSALFTVPLLTTDVITSILLANPTVTDATVRIGIGGTADANILVPDSLVAAGGLVIVSLAVPLSASQALHGLASVANKVAVTVSGYRVT